MTLSRTLALAFASAALLLAAGCSGGSPPEQPELDPSLAANVLEGVPSDIARTYVDFGSKVHLVGYKVEPEGVTAPGTLVKLTLYWQPQVRLGRGWRLFTHVLDDRDRQIANLDNVGPLRKLEGAGPAEHQTLGPSEWQPGKIYVDEQTFQVPGDTRSTELTFAVGVWRGNTRLPILSGRADRQNRAIVAHLVTGLRPPPPAPKASTSAAPAPPVAPAPR
ncbi:MAG: hypothetical protein OZ921_09175 [Sorangiineae bacterium]|nr:hypothetical protein [Polyangiaceae bacterium]MEB2322674.1 hypothetical protein [Sorangiineae bacterium]